MKKLELGRVGALEASSAKAVQMLRQRRLDEGKVERPDAPTRGSGTQVTVKIHAPKVDKFLQARKKPLR